MSGTADFPRPAPAANRLVAAVHAVRRRMMLGVDHAGVRERVRDDGELTGRYLVMALLSAGIALLGLLTASSAVVIGAMLVSPLMGPILGVGFSLAASDVRGARRSFVALVLGCLLAVAFCVLIVAVSPLKAMTPEILSRTRPNLFDLLIAVLAALAGSYATIRGKGGTIVGVAIATALMPPLAVVGYGLATRNRPVFLGSAQLFATNAVSIALTAALIARLFGFRSRAAKSSTLAHTAILLAIFVALAVPLTYALDRIAREARASSAAHRQIDAYFGAGARVTDLNMNFDAEPATVRAVVLTRRFRAGAAAAIGDALRHDLGQPCEIKLSQLVTARGESEQAQAQRALTASRDLASMGEASAPPGASGEGDAIAGELAALAGAGAVTIDDGRKRVAVAAPARAGFALVDWRRIEAAVAAAHPGWTVAITPPPAPLPLVGFAPGNAALDPAAINALDTNAWAVRRWRAGAIAAIGRAASRGDGARRSARALAARRAGTVVAALAARGIVTSARVDGIGPRQRVAERDQGLAPFRSVEVTVADTPPRLP